jgi:adenylate kinase
MAMRNPFVTVIVTGVPGVGKTTVLKHVKDMAAAEGLELLVLNFGDFMLSEAKRRGFAEHRDQIRYLPLRKQLELQGYAAKAIIDTAMSKLGPDGYLLVDTHAIVRTATGYWPGLPRHVIETLRPDSIVVVEAPPEQIVARQLRDRTRSRTDLADVNLVKELIEVARSAAIASAVLVSASVYIVENLEGRAEEAAKSIITLLKSLR